MSITQLSWMLRFQKKIYGEDSASKTHLSALVDKTVLIVEQTRAQKSPP